VLCQLRTLYNLGSIGSLTDGQLLERFATDADELAELAFSALVERHQAMVWRVCLAILRDQHDAEEAFQATFLVLVRKARSLWVRDSLGPWLHLVACRTASCLRTTVLRRRKHEQRCAARDAARFLEVGTPRDLDRVALIHEEVNRLPEKYRLPIVLCDLQGHTHQEAARFLGWPIGTVKSRLSQGRGRIRDQLVRRGLELTVAGAVLESTKQLAVATMAKGVSQCTVKAAMQQSPRLLAGFGCSSQVLMLTQEVLRAMLWIRFRFLTVATLAAGIVSGGAAVYVRGAQEPAPKDGSPVLEQSTTTTVQTPPSNSAKEATEQPATAKPQPRLRAQQLATRKAKAVYEIARLTREIAELTLEEYLQVDHSQEPADLAEEIKKAGAERKRCEERLAWAERMFKKGYVSKAQKISDELALQKAQFALEQLEVKRRVFKKFAKEKAIKELKSDIEKARADELGKEEAWNLEKIKELKLEGLLRLEAK